MPDLAAQKNRLGASLAAARRALLQGCAQPEEALDAHAAAAAGLADAAHIEDCAQYLTPRELTEQLAEQLAELELTATSAETYLAHIDDARYRFREPGA
jgi:hypothetical protein